MEIKIRKGIIANVESYEKNGETKYIYMVHRRGYDTEKKKPFYDHIDVYSNIRHDEQEMITYKWKSYDRYGRYEEIEEGE